MTRSFVGHGNYNDPRVLVFACPSHVHALSVKCRGKCEFPQVKNSQFKSIYQCENLVKLQATNISDRSVSEFRVGSSVHEKKQRK